MEGCGFVDHPHKRHARLPRTASEPEEGLGEPAGGMDSNAEDHIDAKEAWYCEIEQQELENDSNESKNETSLAPAQASSRNTNEMFTSSLITAPAPAQTCSRNTNETFTSSLITAPAPAQTCSRNTNETFMSSLIAAPAPAQTSSRNTNETFTSSLIATPEKPPARMRHALNVGPL
ncbi:hypothetical protein JB92DRAFT_3114310 [Gautieria morchelliformis]|nr:hypothetical protein JB92DRAFT_3114310 [Gautieria morchelliformis]